MQGAVAVFLITLGLGQLASTRWGLRAASLVGPGRLPGYGLGTLLLVIGGLILPANWPVLWWTFPTGLLAVVLLLLGGSFIAPPPHPDRLFAPNHPAHGGCSWVQIPDGDDLMPGILLFPPPPSTGRQGAVCIVPGAGDTKTSFKWRLVQALLAEGLTVLTIDPPGHGEYRHRPMSYPDCLSAVPAAVRFLRKQPGVRGVGVAGISLGGALAVRSLAEGSAVKADSDSRVDALVVLETSVRLKISRALVYGEMWRTFYGAPVLSILREMSVRQVLQGWYGGGYRSQHNTPALIELLNPVESIKQLKNIPILLVYSRRDRVAPPEAARAMQQAAPQARLIESKKASHVTLTLVPEINRQVARWLRQQLSQ